MLQSRHASFESCEVQDDEYSDVEKENNESKHDIHSIHNYVMRANYMILLFLLTRGKNPAISLNNHINININLVNFKSFFPYDEYLKKYN